MLPVSATAKKASGPQAVLSRGRRAGWVPGERLSCMRGPMLPKLLAEQKRGNHLHAREVGFELQGRSDEVAFEPVFELLQQQGEVGLDNNVGLGSPAPHRCRLRVEEREARTPREYPAEFCHGPVGIDPKSVDADLAQPLAQGHQAVAFAPSLG